MTSVWQTDATYVREKEDFSEKMLVVTSAIKRFLETERDTKYLVVATKGKGKTLLLRYKRLLYQEKYRSQNLNLIPRNALVDKFTVSINFNMEQIQLFSNEEIWRDVWLFSIILSTVRNMENAYNRVDYKKETTYNINRVIEKSRIASKLLNNKNRETPLDYLGTILNLGFRDFYSLRAELDNLLSAIRGASIPTAIFLDDIDEIFVRHLQDNAAAPYGRTGVMSPHMWYLSQIGLIKAIRALSNINHHIKVFASIRKEAYVKFKETNEMSLQFQGNVLDLNYTKRELKEMFLKNILNMDSEYLLFPHGLDIDPIYSFLGEKEIIDPLTDIAEDVYSHIYRHTLKRPRDIMSMGDALSWLENENKNKLSLIKTIKSVSDDIASQYISEVAPHIDITLKELDELFNSINTMIISNEDLKKICSNLNSESLCEQKDCKKCSRTHIFCNLFKAGLLGFVYNDYATKTYIQRFLQPGDMISMNSGCLPASSFYFIHPVLSKFVLENKLNKCQLDRKMIVGDGYPCDLNLMLKYYINI
jgi:hypothetical protein